MGAKNGNIAIVYSSIAVLSLLLLIGYLLWEKKKEKHFTLLFACVAVANCGYFLQSVVDSLEGALWANRISYFGGAYFSLLMLLVVMDTCQIRRKKWMTNTLLMVSTAAFLLAASGGWNDLYYKAVDIVQVNGMTRLVKEYGPLHMLYPVYLLSYFAMMTVSVAWAAKTKRLVSVQYTAFLTAAVVLNIGVWAVEQVIDIHFEFLSVSYIVTEVMLLLIYGMLRSYGIVQPGGALLSVQMFSQMHTKSLSAGQLPPDMDRLFASFIQKAQTLSSAEHRILQYYVNGYETADIPDLAFISIHTVKKHNRSIYQKLEVSSRDELMLYIELLRCCGRLGELNRQDPITE
jgi:DNA-binding CsgD family transcriptional regulator